LALLCSGRWRKFAAKPSERPLFYEPGYDTSSQLVSIRTRTSQSSPCGILLASAMKPARRKAMVATLLVAGPLVHAIRHVLSPEQGQFARDLAPRARKERLISSSTPEGQGQPTDSPLLNAQFGFVNTFGDIGSAHDARAIADAPGHRKTHESSHGNS
jgi:hypothetical protein